MLGLSGDASAVMPHPAFALVAEQQWDKLVTLLGDKRQVESPGDGLLACTLVDGYTILHHVVLAGDTGPHSAAGCELQLTAMNLLLRSGAHPDAVSDPVRLSRTPLHCAALRVKECAAKLDGGSDQPSWIARQCLQFAVGLLNSLVAHSDDSLRACGDSEGHTACDFLPLELQDCVRSPDATKMLCSAINADSPSLVRRWFDRGADVVSCIQDKDFARSGNTPLMIAIQGGHMEALNALLECDGSPSQLDMQDTGLGSTALAWAAYTSNTDAARALIHAGANLDIRSSRPRWQWRNDVTNADSDQSEHDLWDPYSAENSEAITRAKLEGLPGVTITVESAFKGPPQQCYAINFSTSGQAEQVRCFVTAKLM
jgi:ankyrin repeat protein